MRDQPAIPPDVPWTMSVEEIAAASGLGVTNLRRMIHAGTIPHYHVGDKDGTVRIDVVAFREWSRTRAVEHLAEHRRDV